MRRDELRRAIELPAQRAGLAVEPELVDALLADVEGRPGALPLLSTALLELWQRRDGRPLRLRAYEHAGGVARRGRAARRAAPTSGSTPEQRPVARRILLRLAGDGVVPSPRSAATSSEGGEVVELLAGERLRHAQRGRSRGRARGAAARVAAAAGWLEEDAQGRRLHLHLREAARAVGRR